MRYYSCERSVYDCRDFGNMDTMFDIVNGVLIIHDEADHTCQFAENWVEWTLFNRDNPTFADESGGVYTAEEILRIAESCVARIVSWRWYFDTPIID